MTREDILKASEEMKKPALGLMPKYIYETRANNERISMILDAMKRCSDADEPIPLIWIQELEERINDGFKARVEQSYIAIYKGYDLEHLFFVADMLREAGIRPENLKDLFDDTTTVLNIALNQFNDGIKKSMEEVFKK